MSNTNWDRGFTKNEMTVCCELGTPPASKVKGKETSDSFLEKVRVVSITCNQ